MNQRGAARVRQQLAAQADQSARRDSEIHAHAAGAVIAHLDHFAAAAAKRFHDDADKILGNVDHQALERFELSAVFGAHYDFRLADHQFEAFAAHGFDQNRQLQFAAAQHAEGFRSVGILHADGDVGEQFLLQTIAQIARSQVVAFACRKAGCCSR